MSEDSPIRVILVDDHQNIHDAVTALLKTVDDITLVGEAFRGEDAIQMCRNIKPDVVLMDVLMPGMNGVETTQAILANCSNLRVLALSSFHEYDVIRQMLDSGAIGYLVKDALAADLIDTIRATHRGNTVLSPEVADALLSPLPAAESSGNFGLTDREQQVLQLMANGLTNARIAETLCITAPTVRFHLTNILAKFGVETRSQALVLAAKHRLVE
ncbi:MAG: response regulator transcription factor [Anaerolineae bacterium]|nr:response regulator transcription factor [Anaerolineae bacterium]